MNEVSAREFTIPQLPAFDNPDDQRRHLKQRLAAALRLFALYGFDEGVAGHITARDPERSDHFWVNPFGMYFGHIKASDLVLVNHDGDVVEGNRPVNAAAFAIHSQVHQARPDVVSAAHAHSPSGKAWASLARPLGIITQDACAFFEDQSLLAGFTGVVVDLEEGRRIARTLEQHKAIILQNHGLLTVGQTVDEAAWWFITMERSCQAQLAAEAVGKPVIIDEDSAQSTHNVVGSHLAGWFSFQPLFDRIVRDQPDLLE